MLNTEAGALKLIKKADVTTFTPGAKDDHEDERRRGPRAGGLRAVVSGGWTERRSGKKRKVEEQKALSAGLEPATYRLTACRSAD